MRNTSIVSTVEWLVEPNAAEGEEGSLLTVIDLYGAMGGHGGDAAFIVTAVNAHDALVEVLKTAESLNSLQHAGISADEMALAWSDLYQQTAKARAALKLAEGKEDAEGLDPADAGEAQPEPYGHCDTCGAVCVEVDGRATCPADSAHQTAIW